MGVIRRQAAWQSIVNYLGTAIGAAAILWVYPLEGDAYGRAQFLAGTGQFLIPFVSLGGITLVVRFFPEFKGKAWREGYLLNMLLIATLAVGALGALTWAFGGALLEGLRKLGFRDEYLYEYSSELILIAILLLYSQILVLHASNYKKIVVPSVFQNLLPKLVLPPLILLLYYGKISLGLLIDLWLVTFVVSLIGLAWYLASIGGLDLKPRIRLLNRDVLRRMFSYASFAGASQMGNNLISRIDIVLIALLIDFQASGIYFIAVFLARVVQIPTSAIAQISAPVIAESWIKNDSEEIHRVYKKAGLNLFVLGLFLTSFVLLAADPLFQFSANYNFLIQAVPIFVFLGLTQLVGMLTSVNYHVILYSHLYRFELIFILVAGILNVPLTYYLINTVGITGAAISTLIASCVLNLARLVFIQLRFGMSPFSSKTINSLLLALFCLLFYLFMPRFDSAFYNLLIISGVFAIGYVALAEWLGLTADFKPFVWRLLAKLGFRVPPGEE